MLFSDDELRGLAGSEVFFKGRDCFLERRVEQWAYKNGVLSASVRGGMRGPCQVKVHIAKKKNIDYCECTCPHEFGTLCAHAVAALYAMSTKCKDMPEAAPVKNQSSKPSLLFPKRKPGQTPPVLRFILPTRNALGPAPQDIRIETFIIHGGQSIPLKETAQIADPRDFRYGSNPMLPGVDEFNSVQRLVLRLLHSFCQAHDEPKLQPFELSVLFNESLKGEGIEFYEGKAKPLGLRPNMYVPIVIEVAPGAKNKMTATLTMRHPDDKTRMITGAVIEGRPCWFIDFEGGAIFEFDDSIDEAVLGGLFTNTASGEWTMSQKPELMHDILARLKGHAEVVFRNKDMEQINVTAPELVIALIVSGNAKKVEVEPRFTYGTYEFGLPDLIYAPAFIPLEGEQRWLKRDIVHERDAMQFLCDDCGFVLDGQRLVISDADAIATFVFEHLPSAATRYKIVYAPGFDEEFKSDAVLRPQITMGADNLDWFYFDVSYSAKGLNQKFSQDEIRKQLMLGKNYISLSGGGMVPIAREDFDKVELFTQEFEGQNKSLPAFHVPFIVDQAGRHNLNVTLSGRFKEMHARFMAMDSIKVVPPPEPLAAILRDYQGKGLDWMDFLRDFRLGGILADEMGLGKTLQVLALLKSRIDAGENLPNLVVCPTTLVWNWQAEIKKFLPGLTVLIPQGLDRREQIERIPQHQVVITSYALLRRDAKYYERFEFNYAVLDEAQNIKNRYTLNARMSKLIRSKHRLVLTGTPMENSVADLWSIFDFLMPGFLGSYERFRTRYEMPILKDGDPQALGTLARKIKPFMLRRLKKEVIKELPDKIEQVSLCALEPTQSKTYEQMLSIARREVMDAYESDGFNKSRMKILTIILRLRQICCHPELAHVQLGHRLSVSAKLNLLKEIVQEALSGGHKVLIFSQFVGMLGIIGEYLKKENITYEYMDGSTTDRAGAVERFNNTESTRVFLLSLKVGGVGLNLTSADTVILYEPWWNPAVEDQAVDRAHRIGQKSTVTAYKLICKGTIEEKILELQKRKRNIIDSLVLSEEGIAKKIGWDDIKFILDINQ